MKKNYSYQLERELMWLQSFFLTIILSHRVFLIRFLTRQHRTRIKRLCTLFPFTMVSSHCVFLVRFLMRHHVWLTATRECYETMAANLYCAVLMILLRADASDDASMHSDCIVPQSFPINRPFVIYFNVHFENQ